MLKIKVISGENIDRALKRYRNKVKSTKQLSTIRANNEYTKKSKAKRDQRAKAVYLKDYKLRMEE
ncbi:MULTISPECIES: small ribosomal subunit protein bS21 [Maribacter]|uniref:Small ribosomal subunit protein bS21 n=1 Tax=Maribacter flavus TaxID=1658664 RepID=A0ABU7IDR1_9FLAO|nr:MULTISPECIES: bS21 family ribosomal protein [Maribacter]MDC6403931.1 bS21 family ribosomal protein [Maribacter sp. PR66]MEE1971072.1 bS21 family ribosomal protein [Maribacter flavus]